MAEAPCLRAQQLIQHNIATDLILKNIFATQLQGLGIDVPPNCAIRLALTFHKLGNEEQI